MRVGRNVRRIHGSRSPADLFGCFPPIEPDDAFGSLEAERFGWDTNCPLVPIEGILVRGTVEMRAVRSTHGFYLPGLSNPPLAAHFHRLYPYRCSGGTYICPNGCRRHIAVLRSIEIEVLWKGSTQ